MPGSPNVIEDLVSIGMVLKSREEFETFGASIPDSLGNLGEMQLRLVQEAIKVSALHTPQALPFALSMLMRRLAASWQAIRLAIAAAGSDLESRVAATSYGIVVTMVIHDLSHIATQLRQDLKQGRLESLSQRLKIVHDGLRGLRTELNVRSDSGWGKQLSTMRAEISNTLKSELESVPGRVRRLLRQRPDKDINSGTKIEPTEVTDTAALIELVATCRNFASELAINEVTLRTYSDLQHYTESATEALVGSLRGSSARTRPFRQMQVDAAISFCDVLFGHDYASLMKKAADVAISGERKSQAG